MKSCVYYVPEIPPIPSTTRYCHALGLQEVADAALLITYAGDVPGSLGDRFERVVALDQSNVALRARKAKAVAEKWAATRQEDPIFVTTFHYAPALSGFLSNLQWVVDMYDDPYQYLYSNPRSPHEIGVRVLTKLLDRSTRTILTAHPSTPHKYGRELRFAMNGAPVEEMQPAASTNGETLSGVCSGVKGNLRPILEGIKRSQTKVCLDVFGDVERGDVEYVRSLGIGDVVEFHGEAPNQTVRSAVEQADIGFSLPHYRPDWEYAYFIKVGEYLAGGTIPVVSPFTGVRDQVRDSGIYIERNGESIGEVLDMLGKSPVKVQEMKGSARRRGEKLNWTDERRWFGVQALFSDVVSHR